MFDFNRFFHLVVFYIFLEKSKIIINEYPLTVTFVIHIYFTIQN